jgi:serine/threonine protein kinase
LGAAPQYIGRYRAERVVGAGAFATVWLAEDETLNAPVAIKVLAENWAHDEEVHQRFLEEARILWRADSDHIVRIHNVDTLEDGRPYFVMDFADRGSLQQRMQGRIGAGGRYSVDEAVALSLAIADGLKVAHGLGVVHRDLKPANIMFQSIPAHHGTMADEKLILTDFGMAKSVARSRGTTIATGTPYYMAPEQTEGRADERSDIYSAGVILYELLAGRVPYPYDSPGRLFAAQISAPPAPITSIRDDIPPALDHALSRALATEPNERWPSAEAWTEALTSKEIPPPAPVPLTGTDPDMLRTLAPAEIAAAKAAAGEGAAPGPEPAPPAAAAPPPPTPPPLPAAPPTPTPGEDERRRKRKRAAAIGLPLVAVIAAAIAAVLALVLTGTSQADAKTLTLDPISSLGTNPFTGSTVPTTKTPISNLSIPTSFSGLLPSQLFGTNQPTTLSNQQLFQKLTPIYNGLLLALNPAIGELSKLKLPLSNGLKPTDNLRPRVFSGNAPGLYGGTQLLTVCDKRAMIAFLERNSDKLKAWAAVQGISPDDVANYISHLTDTVLQFDTRVTNHGYKDGSAFPIDEVLQKGTAVLIDEFGIPRARCYCGNPLTEPRKLASNPKILLGGGLKKPWPGFSLGKTVDPKKSKPTKEFGLIDVVTGTTAIYKVPGATPSEATLTPTLIDPLPGSSAPPVVSIPTESTESTSTETTTTEALPPPPPPPPQVQVSNVTSDGTATASSEYNSGFPASNAIDGNLGTSWFSIGSREGDTSTFTWTSGHGAMLIDHVTIYSNAHNNDSTIRSGFTFSNIQVSVLHNGSVTYSTTVAYPSDHVTVRLGHVGDTVKLLLIHHTNPVCGGFGELQVFGAPASSGNSSGGSSSGSAAGVANDSNSAIAVVTAMLEKEKSGCSMTYTTLTASPTQYGWLVKANVVTSGNPGTPLFGVKKGTAEITAADPLSAEILAGCS